MIAYTVCNYFENSAVKQRPLHADYQHNLHKQEKKELIRITINSFAQNSSDEDDRVRYFFTDFY